MAKKEIKSESAPIVKLKTVGEHVEGYYLRHREGKFDALYDFIDEDGNMFTMAQQSDLASKLCRIPFKFFVEITLVEIKELKGGNTFKVFRVIVDDEKIYGHQRDPGEEG